MPIPTEEELSKLKNKIDKHKKSLNPDGSPKRPFDEMKFKAYFRSAVREKWMFCDTKLAFLLSNRKPVKDRNSRSKWEHNCAKCGGTFKEADVEVDHIDGHKSSTGGIYEMLLEWAKGILNVSFNQLQILCKYCHSIKTRAEELGYDWRDEDDWKKTILEKEYTDICSKKSADQHKWVEQRGIIPDKNPVKRAEQIRALLFYDKRV